MGIKYARNLFLWGLAALYYVWLTDFGSISRNIMFFVFQSRDLSRATALLAGHSIFFGPEMTGGGNLPGPLYYLLLAIPAALDTGWMGAMYLLWSLVVLGALLAWYFFRKRTSLLWAFVALALLLFNSNTHRFLILFLNVSYMIPFTVAAIIFICLAFMPGESRRRGIYFIAASVIMGLALQLHASILFLFTGLVCLQLFARRLKLEPVERRWMWYGFALFLLPSVPFLIWRLTGAEAGQSPGYSGVAQDAMKSLLFLMNNVRSMPISRFLRDGLSHIFEVVPAGLFLLIPIALLPGMRPRNPLFKPLLVCLVFTTIPFLYWCFAPIGCRYGQPFYLLAVFLCVALHATLAEDKRKTVLFNWSAAAVIVGLWIFYWVVPHPVLPPYALISGALAVAVPLAMAYFMERKWSAAALSAVLTIALAWSQWELIGEVRVTPNLMPRHIQWTLMWHEIHRATGWNYARAARRLYFVNHHIEQDSEPPAAEAFPRNKSARPRSGPSGFFVSFQFQPNNLGPPKIKEWLLTQKLQSDVRDALINGKLEVGRSLNEDILIAPYFVKDESELPEHFHNSGEAYARAPEETVLSLVKQPSGTTRAEDGRLVFKWNSCADNNKFCDTGALVQLNEDSKGEYSAQVKILGQAISQVSPWISPTWTEAWVEPYLEITCGRKTQRVRIASSIGYMREYASDPDFMLLLGNNSWVAPFERKFLFKCNGPVREISMGRAASKVETLYEWKTLPAQRLSVTL